MAADTLVPLTMRMNRKNGCWRTTSENIKEDLQGVADSMEYRTSDSKIYFYNNPVLWSEGNQMTADSIRLLLKDNSIDKIFMNVNSFVISTDSLLNYNQIKGRKMTAEFKEQKIHRVIVQGNGESIYYALSEEEKSAMGVTVILTHYDRFKGR